MLSEKDLTCQMFCSKAVFIALSRACAMLSLIPTLMQNLLWILLTLLSSTVFSTWIAYTNHETVSRCIWKIRRVTLTNPVRLTSWISRII